MTILFIYICSTIENMATAILEITNCLDCPFHSVERDPDPDDWFNDDDVKVVCKKIDRNVTVACPYRTREESETPEWCPIKKKKDL